jgi:uncharacterized membrane protein YdbT with pleckstrin-like domain
MLARKPFTLIAAIIFLIIALAHAYRLSTGFQVVLAGDTVPLSISWIGVAIGAILATMLTVEARR